jgi:transposase-like protein
VLDGMLSGFNWSENPQAGHCDGLKGFPEAIEASFPVTVVQTCIVHMIQNSLRFVS